jgi:hypothetical protein
MSTLCSMPHALCLIYALCLKLYDSRLLDLGVT